MSKDVFVSALLIVPGVSLLFAGEKCWTLKRVKGPLNSDPQWSSSSYKRCLHTSCSCTVVSALWLVHQRNTTPPKGRRLSMAFSFHVIQQWTQSTTWNETTWLLRAREQFSILSCQRASNFQLPLPQKTKRLPHSVCCCIRRYRLWRSRVNATTTTIIIRCERLYWRMQTNAHTCVMYWVGLTNLKRTLNLAIDRTTVVWTLLQLKMNPLAKTKQRIPPQIRAHGLWNGWRV